ncbi:MAG: metal-dependent hydrolase [Lentisphaerae bacterium]|nr:metal-dependent hydrolase [Lentisphaerota bacterium]
MKGMAHFAVGAAVASCFPEAVRAAAAGHPLYFLAGGIAGLLPDTLDVCIARLLCRHDIEVQPDPKRFAAQPAAEAVALAIDRAGAAGRPVRIKLNTVRLGADRWRRYTVRFDPAAGRVAVREGPEVDGGGRPYAGTGPGRGRNGDAATERPFRIEYEALTAIDARDGPVFEMAPGADGRVAVRFNPWRRRWSHSLVLAAAAGLAAGLLWNPLAGLIAGLAWAAHALVDQLGYLGGNLWFPFTRRRTPGRGRWHSGDAAANLGWVWFCGLLVFWNLARFDPAGPVALNPLRLLVAGFVAPLVAVRLAARARDGADGAA